VSDLARPIEPHIARSGRGASGATAGQRANRARGTPEGHRLTSPSLAGRFGFSKVCRTVMCSPVRARSDRTRFEAAPRCERHQEAARTKEVLTAAALRRVRRISCRSSSRSGALPRSERSLLTEHGIYIQPINIRARGKERLRITPALITMTA
jgi:hypothetical protein